MAIKPKFPGADIIELNLMIEIRAKHYYRFEIWNPIVGALLLSGIAPSSYWEERHEKVTLPGSPSFWQARFEQLLNALLKDDEAGTKSLPISNQRHLRGIDGATNNSALSRTWDTREILRNWDLKCEDENCHLAAIQPIAFVAWLEELCWNGDIRLRDRTWLDAFLKLHGLEPNQAILPSSITQSFLKVTEIGRAGGWHPLGPEISEAQQEALSRKKDPYAIDVIFPLISGILDARGTIDKSNAEYIPGKTLPIAMDDGSLYVLNRGSLRVYLNRLKRRNLTSQQ